MSRHKGLQGSISKQRKGLPLLSHLQILKWEATACQARVPYQWASTYTYAEQEKRERRGSGGRNTLKSGLTIPASLGWAPLAENLKLLAKFNPTTNAISTLANEVASLKHAVSLFPGCNNTVIICFLTWTTWQFWKSGSPCFVSQRQHCVNSHKDLHPECRVRKSEDPRHACLKSILRHLITANVFRRLLRCQDESGGTG